MVKLPTDEAFCDIFNTLYKKLHREGSVESKKLCPEYGTFLWGLHFDMVFGLLVTRNS